MVPEPVLQNAEDVASFGSGPVFLDRFTMGHASVRPMTFSVGQSARVSYHCMEHAPSRSINILKEFKALYFFARVSFGTSIKIAVHPRKGVPKVPRGCPIYR